MPKTVQDWEARWDRLAGNDAIKTIKLLREYICDAQKQFNIGMAVMHRFQGLAWQGTHTRINEVTHALINVQRTFGYKDASVEWILACVKREIYTYKEYKFKVLRHQGNQVELTHYEDETSNRARIQMALDKIEPGVIYIQHYHYPNFSYEETLDRLKPSDPWLRYTVISPAGCPVTDRIYIRDLHQSFMFQQSAYGGKISKYSSLMPTEYRDGFFEITSQRGHTYGPRIQGIDDLNTLFELIKTKTNIDYFVLDHDEILARYDRLGNVYELFPESAWKTQGDFTQDLPKVDRLFKRQQRYINTTNLAISTIQLSYDDDNNFVLKVETRDLATYTQIQVAFKRAGLPKHQSDSKYVFPNHQLMAYVIWLKSNEPKLPCIANFLNTIVKIDSSTLDVVNDIAGMFGIYRSNVKQDIRTLMAYAKTAQAHQDYETIWKLAMTYKADFFSERGEYLRENSGELLVELFEAISKDNPHYQKAQFELVHIIGQMDRDDINEQTLLEEQFKYACNSGEPILTSQFYHQLSGGTGLMPTINNVMPNVETLLALANERRELNATIGEMQAQIEQLQARVAAMTSPSDSPCEEAVTIGVHRRNPSVFFHRKASSGTNSTGNALAPEFE